MQAQKARNDANNANTIKNAAEVASKTNNPYAKAAGEAVKMADKISGGKASEKLGKKMTQLNKFAPGGRKIQKLSNKLSESGMGDRIGDAASKMGNKNGSVPSGGAKAPNAKTENKIKEKAEQTSAREGSGSVDGLMENVVKYGLFGFAALFPLIIFAVLFTGASQVFVNSISLGTADSLSGEEAEDKINKKGDEGIEEEKSDDDVAYDIYINDENMLRLKNSNVVQVASEKKYLRRKYNEATLDKIEDFYPSVKDVSKNYDENMVYDFFYKMYNLYISYRDNYDVYLDLPLLMATLNLESKDKNVIFNSNLSSEDRQKTSRKLPINEFDYYYDWSNSNYVSNKSTSNHDMEILARNMISKQVKETCVDSSGKETKQNILKDNEINSRTLTCAEGETYKTADLGFVKDDEKYKEFLKEFLEKKYYSKDGFKASEMTNYNTGGTCVSTFTKYMLTEEQLTLLATIAIKEQGSVKGAADKASLMANLFELKGSNYGTGGEGLYNYVVNSGWFGSNTEVLTEDTSVATEEVKKAVSTVLVEGKRTLPAYIDEFDCINCGNISSITIDGKSVSKTEEANYMQHKTIINNINGTTYTFYSFSVESSYVFGYTKQSNREKIGDFYYDFGTGEPINCPLDIYKDGNYVGDVEFANSNFGNVYYYNQGDYKKYYYSTDPVNKSQFKGATISSHGCGPTSLSIVVSSILNKEFTPIKTTSDVCKAGGCFSSGSRYTALTKVGKQYGLKTTETSNKQEVINALASNNSLVIVLMGPGTFTTSGHYIVLTGVNDKGQVSVADPASRKRTEKKWFSFNTIVEQRKTYAPYMIFSR